MRNPIYHSYHIPGQSALYTLKKNAIFVARNNTIRHELSKCLGAIMIHRFGDVFFTPKIIECLRSIESEIRKQKLTIEHHDFISEACPNKQKDRRIDLVDITSGIRYEFETNKTVDKKAVDKLYGETVITTYI